MSAAAPMLMEPRFETKRNEEGRAVAAREAVPVVFATNAKYIMPLCVTVASLVANFDPERELVIHIIGSDLEEKHREDVRRTVEMNRSGLKHITIKWLTIDPNLEVPIDSFLGADAYARLFIPILLPESVERAIYLDCDMVVLTDISRLFDATRGARTAVQAVRDLSMPFVSDERARFDYVERGIPPETGCFNSGLMVMNLKVWRERKLGPAIVEFALKNKARLNYFPDQVALNTFLCQDWTPIDPRWNQCPDVLFPALWERAGLLEEWRRTKDDPYIFHYAGPKKPWQPGRRGPRYSYFFKYLDRTVFKDDFPDPPRLEGIIGLRAYYHIWSIARKLLPGLVRQ